MESPKIRRIRYDPKLAAWVSDRAILFKQVYMAGKRKPIKSNILMSKIIRKLEKVYYQVYFCLKLILL
jgi:hypothetical protein